MISNIHESGIRWVSVCIETTEQFHCVWVSSGSTIVCWDTLYFSDFFSLSPSLSYLPPSPLPPQESLKFPTDAPPNLPLPPLLPGEEILLQQHRVACLESFAEPAVGSIYITNFRIIFNGNSISVSARHPGLVTISLCLWNYCGTHALMRKKYMYLTLILRYFFLVGIAWGLHV